MNDRRMEQILNIINRIEERNKNSNSLSYLDSPDIKLLISSIKKDDDADLDSLLFKYHVTCYIANCYVYLSRFILSAKFYLDAIFIALEIADKYQVKVGNIDNVISHCIRDRNRYKDDDCDDLKVVVNTLISEEAFNEMINRIKEKRRSVKLDIVETSKQYLAVIDEIEEQLSLEFPEMNRYQLPQYWTLKKKLLLEKGIDWSSPQELNPNIRFN